MGKKKRMGEDIDDIMESLKQRRQEDPSFFYSIQPQEAIFWADSSSRMNYASFGDTVFLHKSSTFYNNLPFLFLTGLNHHGHPLLFGSGLLLSTPSLSSFSFFLRSWLHSMPSPPPLSLTTPFNPLLLSSIPLLFPHTLHLFSPHSLLQKSRKKLAKTYRLHPSFESDFSLCVRQGGTVEEFESRWVFLLEKYNLLENRWISSIYAVRRQWVPVFTRGVFLGVGGRKNMSFFQGCVDHERRVTVFENLMKRCEEAVEYWRKEEMGADCETSCSTTMPGFKTSSSMEEQAAIVYTRHGFFMFQRELVGSFGYMAVGLDEGGECVKYKVTKLGEDGFVHMVRWMAGMKPECSCLLFESSGIVCRHILAVLRAGNVESIPPYCILKRWSRNGRGGGGGDSFGTWNYSRELAGVRYDHLWKEAVKYVEEGSRSVRIYGVAVEVLGEATKKVSSVNNSGFCRKDCESLGNRIQMMHQSSEGQRESYPLKAEKARKIQELRCELKKVNKRCEVYRENLTSALKTTQDQNMKLLVKAHKARLSLKE